MRAWLLSLVGIVFVGVLLDVILPEGKTNAFIKHVFAIFILFIIVSPLGNLVFKGDWFNNTTTDVIDTNFIYKNNLNKIEALEKDIAKNLNKVGIKKSSVIISADIFSESLPINQVYVDVTNAEIESSIKNVKETIMSVVKEIVNVNDSEVVVYGK